MTICIYAKKLEKSYISIERRMCSAEESSSDRGYKRFFETKNTNKRAKDKSKEKGYMLGKLETKKPFS